MKATRFTILALCLTTALGFGQEDSSRPATPPASQPGVVNPGGQDVQQPETPEYESDKSPLSGMQNITLGFLSSSRNTLNTGFWFAQYLQSSPSGGGGNDVGATSSFGGNLSLELASLRHSLTLHYNANGIVTAGYGSTQVTQSHQLGFSESIVGRRWTLTVSDTLGYTPDSPFGNGIFGWAGTYGYNPNYGSGLGNTLIPNDTILRTGFTSQLNNTVGAQVQYRLTPRTSLTVHGSYGTLRYSQPELFDTAQYSVGFGLDRRLTARDTIAVTYTHASYWVPNQVGFSTNQTESVLGSYGRQLTGRLALQISAGPLISKNRNTTWTSNTGLTYQRGRNALSASYVASIGGGSGVYSGARYQTVRASWGRSITRRWHTTIAYGFARNSALTASSDVNTHFAQFIMGRSLGRSAEMQLSYDYQNQSVPSNCAGVQCTAFGGSRHIVGVHLNWHFRPVRIE